MEIIIINERRTISVMRAVFRRQRTPRQTEKNMCAPPGAPRDISRIVMKTGVLCVDIRLIYQITDQTKLYRRLWALRCPTVI